MENGVYPPSDINRSIFYWMIHWSLHNLNYTDFRCAKSAEIRRSTILTRRAVEYIMLVEIGLTWIVIKRDILYARRLLKTRPNCTRNYTHGITMLGRRNRRFDCHGGSRKGVSEIAEKGCAIYIRTSSLRLAYRDFSEQTTGNLASYNLNYAMNSDRLIASLWLCNIAWSHSLPVLFGIMLHCYRLTDPSRKTKTHERILILWRESICDSGSWYCAWKWARRFTHSLLRHLVYERIKSNGDYRDEGLLLSRGTKFDFAYLNY